MPELKPFPITWEQMHRDAKILADKIKAQGNFKLLLAVVRGGLVPAAIISKQLDLILVDTICLVKKNNDDSEPFEMPIKSIEGDGKDVLIIDDLVDTGHTARLIRELYPKAFFATLYTKPIGENLVDTYVTKVEQDNWIIFPWEKHYNNIKS